MNIYCRVRARTSQVLIAVIMALALVFTLGVAILIHSRSFRDASNLQVDSDKAYSLARSGIDVGKKYAAAHSDQEATILDKTYSIGEGTMKVLVVNTKQNNIILSDITSTGIFGKSQRVLAETRRTEVPTAPTCSGWIKVYGGISTETLYAAKEVSTGGYILGGQVCFSGCYMGVMKLLSNGDLDTNFGTKGVKTFHPQSASGDNFKSLQETGDNGYILGGSCTYSGSSDFIVIKLLSNGALDTSFGSAGKGRRYGGGGSDILWSLQQTSDNGYILGGYTTSFDDGTHYDFLVIKLTSTGALDTTNFGPTGAKIYGASGSNDLLYSLQQTDDDGDGYADDGYIFGGPTLSFNASSFDFLIIKTTSNGGVTWNKKYGGTGTDQLRFVQQTDDDGDGRADDGYIIGGKTDSTFDGAENGNDFLVMKIDSNGDFTWGKRYGGTGSEDFYWLQQTSDGGYILGGYSNSFSGDSTDYDALAIKTDANGNKVWAKTYGATGATNYKEYLMALQQTSDGGYILGGTSWSFGHINDFMAIKTNSSGELGCCSYFKDVTTSVGVYPTPTLTSSGVTGTALPDSDLTIKNDHVITVGNVDPATKASPCPQ